MYTILYKYSVFFSTDRKMKYDLNVFVQNLFQL